MRRIFSSQAGIALVVVVLLGGTASAQLDQQQYLDAPNGPDEIEILTQMQDMMASVQDMMADLQDMMVGMQDVMVQGDDHQRRGMMHRRHRMGRGGQGMMHRDDDATDDGETFMSHGRMAHQGRTRQGRRMGQMGMRPYRSEQLARQLDLSEDQRAQVQNLLYAHAKEAIRLRADIGVIALDLEQLLDAESVDLPKAKALVQAMTAKETDLRLAHLALIPEMTKLLTSEQRKTFRALRHQ